MAIQEPAIKQKFGPYYESAISKSQPQRTALGQPALSPAQLAGITAGELEARYQSDFSRKQQKDEIRLKEEALDIQKQQAEGSQMGNMIKGGLGGAMAGAAIGKPCSQYGDGNWRYLAVLLLEQYWGGYWVVQVGASDNPCPSSHRGDKR